MARARASRPVQGRSRPLSGGFHRGPGSRVPDIRGGVPGPGRGRGPGVGSRVPGDPGMVPFGAGSRVPDIRGGVPSRSGQERT